MFVIRFHIFITTWGGGRQGCNLYIPDLLLSYKILKNYLDFVTGDELAPCHHGGNPLLPIDTVLVGLSILGGGHYHRVSAILEGVAIQTASTHLKRLCDAVNLVLAPLTLHLPTARRLEENEQYLAEKYHLPGFGYGVDGVFLYFDEKPRGIPGDRPPQSFFGRKLRYAINAQVVGGPDGLIYNLDLSSPGSLTDSTTWRCSDVKPELEQRHPHYLIAGDSGYPKSKTLVTPYTTQEALNDDRKRLFNLRHSGLRTECTEHIFGRWKKRWPFVKYLRCHWDKACRCIYATAVLQNLSIMWDDEMPDEPDDEDEDEPQV